MERVGNFRFESRMYSGFDIEAKFARRALRLGELIRADFCDMTGEAGDVVARTWKQGSLLDV